MHEPAEVRAVVPVPVMHPHEVAAIEYIQTAAGEGVGVVVGACGSRVLCGVHDVHSAVGVVFAAFDYAAAVV